MDTSLDARTISRNLWRDSMQDGLMELLLGACFVLAGFAIQVDMSVLFIILAAFLAVVEKKTKERFTYPRIGYVKFPRREKDPGRYMVAALISAVVVVTLVVILFRTGEKTRTLYQWVPLLPAFLLMAGFAFAARRTGLKRYYAMAAFSLLAGLLIPFVETPGKMGSIALYLFVVGPVLLVWGAVVFANFLRTHPVLTEEAE